MANEFFFPSIEPFEIGQLKVGKPHQLYWEQCGNPQGEPIIAQRWPGTSLVT